MASLGSGDGEPEFQVAPMIDVLLTILIFFMMITSAQVLKVDKKITLPLASEALKKDNMRNEAIVNIRWENRKATYVFEDKLYSHANDLIPLLKMAKSASTSKKITRDNQEFRAVLRGDKEVPALYVSLAMNACAEAGIADMSFSTVNKH